MLDVHNTTLADLARIAREQGERGRVATARGLIPWQRSSVKGRSGTGQRAMRRLPAPTPEQMKAELSKDLPPVIRREARERYRVLANRLYADGLKSYELFGYPVWPKSVQDELRAFGWKEGNPDLWGQVEALARKYVEEGAHKQKEKDQKKSSLDWHGHLTA